MIFEQHKPKKVVEEIIPLWLIVLLHCLPSLTLALTDLNQLFDVVIPTSKQESTFFFRVTNSNEQRSQHDLHEKAICRNGMEGISTLGWKSANVTCEFPSH